ncbi:MAG: twin-arginine translocase TatA/TatE family subunit [Acidimicrobiia bacterium]|nr:twin-arginine translocase TatA/TatE family subunit [Acidimicrobiia bacterium]MYC57113.1 twin-arginine translocase TatA/TatE family subunit [Acidimicrobiia bacterium]MYG94785.1 twin-arginine translocase TatA/TatE family subunit [Acidimicrobiia bacterium]MYI30190.1 twin-arginine translocase TatA/TatE family subunit [Acidimicrobiia bacterium]
MSTGGSELIIILIIVLVLFGGAKLPKLARSLGQAQKEFKQGVADGAASAPDSASQPNSENKSDEPPATGAEN